MTLSMSQKRPPNRSEALMIYPVFVWLTRSSNPKNLLIYPRFNSTSASNKMIYPTTNCLIATKLEKCQVIVLAAPEAQLQGGGLNVIAHLASV